MKHSRKTTRNVLLTCVMAMALLCGVYASPAFASHDDDMSSDAGVTVQQKEAAVEPDDQGNASAPEGTTAPEDNEAEADEGQHADATSPEASEPSGPLGVIMKIPEVFGGEAVALFANATDSRQVVTTPALQDDWKWPYNTYDKIHFGGVKTWKDADGVVTDNPKTPEGEDIESITIRIEGFVDWNDNNVLDDWERNKSKLYRMGDDTSSYAYTAEGSANDEKWAGAPYYSHDAYSAIDQDLNGDGVVDWKDSYFDMPDRNGELGKLEDRWDHCFDHTGNWNVSKYPYDFTELNYIIAPYQVHDITVERKDWMEEGRSYWTKGFSQEFYEFQPYTTVVTESLGSSALGDGQGVDEGASATEVTTISFVFDDEGIAKRHMILYEATELPVDGYVTISDPPDGGLSVIEEELSNAENGRVYHDIRVEVNFTNIPAGPLDKTGQITIEKAFDGPIYANGYTGADGSAAYNEGNASVAVFRIVGNLAEDGTGETVFDAYRSLSFYADGASSQSIVIDNLPVGAWYTVTEVAFDGSGYVATDGSVRKFQLIADEHDEPDEGDVVDEGEGAGDADEPAVTATYTVSFSNRGTVTESPNQGWVNRYAPDGENIYTIKQIKRTEQLS